MGSAPIVVFDDPKVIIMRFRALIGYRWKATPDEPLIARMKPALMGAVDAISGKMVLCSIGSSGIGVPDAATRNELERNIRAIEPRCAGVVNLVPGTGFSNATLRAVITGMSLVTRPGHPVKTVSTAREAATLIAQWWPADAEPTTSVELARFVESMLG